MDKGTAITGKTFQGYCENKFVKLIYGTSLLQRNLKDKKSMNESTGLALEVKLIAPQTRREKPAIEVNFEESRR